MRIASVLHDASIEKDGAPLLPTVALERDGALYSVTELARALGARCAFVEDASDFHHTVIALRGESCRELDERVRSGERPSTARLLPGTFTWLPPCDVERAALVSCDGDGAPLEEGRGPAFRIGSARALLGHDATVPVLGGSEDLGFSCAVAAVLGDDLFRATAREAHEAILGYAPMLAFEGGLGAQLGPALVTRDEVGPLAKLRAHIRVDGQPLALREVGDRPVSAAEAIAWISHHVPLRAGDVIGAAPLELPASAPPRVAFGVRVEVAVERLGRLAGKAARGPEMRAWRLER